jgi:hypothetical protein
MCILDFICSHFVQTGIYSDKQAQNYNILSGVLNILNKNVKIKMFYKRTVITKGDKRMTRRPVC